MSYWKFVEYRSSTTSSFTLPKTARRVIVDATGAGGGPTTSTSAEGGGGGGAFARTTREVSGGETIYFQVGSLASQGQAGGNSIASFNSDLSSPFVMAEGGQSSATQTGGVGGSAASSIGDIKNNGGNGASGQGGGGARAGSSGGTAGSSLFGGLNGRIGTGALPGTNLQSYNPFLHLCDTTQFPKINGTSTLGFVGANLAGSVASSEDYIAVLGAPHHFQTPIGGCNIAVSSNGITWTPYRAPQTDNARYIFYANGEFIIVGDSSTTRRFQMFNQNTATWRTLSTGLNFFEKDQIVFAGGYYIFPVIGATGITRTANLSTGSSITWSNNNMGYCFSAANGNTVIVIGSMDSAAADAQTLMLYSSDAGANWTDTKSIYNGTLIAPGSGFTNPATAYGCAYNKFDKKFYAIAGSTSNSYGVITLDHRLYESSDGLNWSNTIISSGDSTNPPKMFSYAKANGIVFGIDPNRDNGFKIMDDGTFLLGTALKDDIFNGDQYYFPATLTSKDGKNWIPIPIGQYVKESANFKGKNYFPGFEMSTVIYGSSATVIEDVNNGMVVNCSNSQLNFVTVFDPVNYDSNYTAIPIFDNVVNSVSGDGGLSASTGQSGQWPGEGAGGSGNSNDGGQVSSDGMIRIYYTEARKIVTT